jgi:hypothetical protein
VIDASAPRAERGAASMDDRLPEAFARAHDRTILGDRGLSRRARQPVQSDLETDIPSTSGYAVLA